MFIVLELQTQADGSVIIGTPIQRETRNEADSDYHRILQYAAISALPEHAAVIIDEAGNRVDGKCYRHPPEPEPEPEET